MNYQIRPFSKSDLNDLLQITLLAFEPAVISFEKILGPKIYPIVYPDWHKSQREWVEQLCNNQKTTVLVAEVDGATAGFLVYELYARDLTGEVQFLAVHPAYQNQGIAAALNAVALQQMKVSGMKLALVNTGGDESHAPARKTYEKAGYTALPLTRFYKDL
jgi:ribosomal protein S18 acetylase RimI-like enzyme